MMMSDNPTKIYRLIAAKSPNDGYISCAGIVTI